MTDEELSKFIEEHRHWSRLRLLAFVEANMEFDIEAEKRRVAKEIIDEAVRSGVLVSDGHGNIIVRHLTAIKDEIGAFDPKTLNLDTAGDKAEIVRQVLAMLVDQRRGFGQAARMEIAQKEAEDEDDDL